MNLIKIGAFIKGYWREYPFDRWNGRQIRNACLTAVALAEYEAQGEDPDDVLKPNAVVELKDSHLEDVAKTYLEFSEHMKDIYGTHAARRAKEAGLRAMWVDGKGKLVGNIGQKEAGIIKGSRKGQGNPSSRTMIHTLVVAVPQIKDTGANSMATTLTWRHYEDHGWGLHPKHDYGHKGLEKAEFQGDYRDLGPKRPDLSRDPPSREVPSRPQEQNYPGHGVRYH
ncbi:hypothetical protein S40288_09194 [Stachybotrys chartarum IBT 40288]|nr:hypothetical protein S40288_09194 [Stachybotrys chartarum IBT 40288]